MRVCNKKINNLNYSFESAFFFIENMIEIEVNTLRQHDLFKNEKPYLMKFFRLLLNDHNIDGEDDLVDLYNRYEAIYEIKNKPFSNGKKLLNTDGYEESNVSALWGFIKLFEIAESVSDNGHFESGDYFHYEYIQSLENRFNLPTDALFDVVSLNKKTKEQVEIKLQEICHSQDSFLFEALKPQQFFHDYFTTKKSIKKDLANPENNNCNFHKSDSTISMDELPGYIAQLKLAHVKHTLSLYSSFEPTTLFFKNLGMFSLNKLFKKQNTYQNVKYQVIGEISHNLTNKQITKLTMYFTELCLQGNIKKETSGND